MPSEDPVLVRHMGRWLAETQGSNAPSSVEVLGHKYRVLPDVFSPGFYSESAFYAAALTPWFKSGTTFLDVGCGAGVNSVIAASSGARVVALDVNPAAVANTRINAAAHGVTDLVDARESDVFSAVTSNERFDIVYWNVPFTYRSPETTLSALEEAIFDPGYRKNQAYLAGAQTFLAPGGMIFMGISPTLGLADEVSAFAAEVGLAFEVLREGREAGTSEVLQFLRLNAVVKDITN